jgi:hypothetical protein
MSSFNILFFTDTMACLKSFFSKFRKQALWSNNLFCSVAEIVISMSIATKFVVIKKKSIRERFFEFIDLGI